MAAVELMRPLLHEIDSRLPPEEKELAINRFTSVYGSNYANQKDLVSLLELCVQDNKINPSNITLLKEGLVERSSSKADIGRLIDDFNKQNSLEIREWRKKQPSEFVGRDVGWLGSILEKSNCVLLWGPSGVGKTKLARQFMKSQTDRPNVVDLRGVNSIDLVYVEILKLFNKLVSYEEVTIGLVISVVKGYVKERNSLLLFDNADDFVHYCGFGENQTSEFASLIKELLENSIPRLKMIITSRNKSEHSAASFLHQEQLMPLNDESASTIIKSRMIHEREVESKRNNETVMRAVNQCKKLPLNLNILGAALQERGIKLESMLPIIMKNAQEWKELKSKEMVSVPDEDFYTYGVLESRFEQLSDTIQQAAIALSLFTRTFSLTSVAAVLRDFEESKIHLVINYLKGTHFMNYVDKDVYDMHPKIREFLIGKTSFSSEIKEFYLKAKDYFKSYYKEQLVTISNYIDDDYLKAYNLYQDVSSDFEFIFREKDNEMILVDDYNDNQQIAALLRGMLEPSRRLEVYQNLTEIAFSKGKPLVAIQYLSHLALEESFCNEGEAFDITLLRVQHTLETLREKRDYLPSDKRLDGLFALYYYAKGDIQYKIIQSSFSVAECEAAIETVEKSMEIRQRLHPEGHTDIIRSYIVIGNCYNIMEDIHRTNKAFDRTEPCLAKALDFYTKALEMRERLSHLKLHIDMPQILSNIGTIWYERGRLSQGKENEKAMGFFKQAETFFQRSLEAEKELKLDGLYQSSVKLINLGDLQNKINEFDKALDNFEKALEIRKELKGDHKHTVLVMYRIAVTNQNKKNFANAARYYKDAFEMEERLPDDAHTAVRFDIRKYLVIAYKYWARQVGDKNERKRINQEREELEKLFKELEKKEKQGKKDESKDPPKGPSRKKAETPAPQMDVESIMAVSERFVDGAFDKNGCHVSFRYYHVYLTIPRNVTEERHNIRILRLTEDKVTLDLKDSEFLVSVIIDLHTTFNGVLKKPAMLEIQCDITDSRIGKFSELAMIRYDAVSKSWIDVEKVAILKNRFYWYNENELVPIIQAWIYTFSTFAVVLRPKKEIISVPHSGLIWRPFHDGRISLNFPPGCFGEAATSLCTVKVVLPEEDTVNNAIQKHNLLLSPAINVQVREHVGKPVKISLPLLNKPFANEGYLKILKKYDDAEDLKVEELLPNFNSKENIVEIEVASFSWVMAVWSLSRDITVESMKWATDMIFRFFQYDVDIHLFKSFSVADSSIIGVCCAPLKTNSSHWLERISISPESGYLHVQSSPSLERLCDSAMINVDVRGQFINRSKPDDVDLLRFNCRNVSPWPIQLKESGIGDKGGRVLLEKLDGKKRLCTLPYMKDFRLMSDTAEEHHARRRTAQIRFLGLSLEKCGLDCMNISHNFFRNNLYRTGLHEAFIDELKLDAYNTSRQMIVKKFLDEITLLFVKKELPPNWFFVFRAYTHPPFVQENLIKVMDILEKQLRFVNDKVINDIAKCIEHGNSFQGFLQYLASKLAQPHLQEREDQHSKQVFERAFRKFIQHQHTTMDLIREILLLKRDGYQGVVDSILDKIGKVIEDYLPYISQ